MTSQETTCSQATAGNGSCSATGLCSIVAVLLPTQDFELGASYKWGSQNGVAGPETTDGVTRESKSHLGMIYYSFLPTPLSKGPHPHLWKFLFHLTLLIVVVWRGRNLGHLGSTSLSLTSWDKKQEFEVVGYWGRDQKDHHDVVIMMLWCRACLQPRHIQKDPERILVMKPVGR